MPPNPYRRKDLKEKKWALREMSTHVWAWQTIVIEEKGSHHLSPISSTFTEKYKSIGKNSRRGKMVIFWTTTTFGGININKPFRWLFFSATVQSTENFSKAHTHTICVKLEKHTICCEVHYTWKSNTSFIFMHVHIYLDYLQ
jgi:hypothetical protein